MNWVALKIRNEHKFAQLDAEWRSNNRAHLKKYNRTAMRRTRAKKQKVTDRHRALRHLARHITKLLAKESHATKKETSKNKRTGKEAC
jgi:hypothetical protein